MSQNSNLNLKPQIANGSELKSFYGQAYVSVPGFGVEGFMFDIEGSTQINLESDVTDHFIEDNTAIQDHIALRPITLQLKFYQGENVYFNDPLTPLGRLNLQLKPPQVKLNYIPTYAIGTIATKSLGAKLLGTLLTVTNMFAPQLNAGMNVAITNIGNTSIGGITAASAYGNAMQLYNTLKGIWSSPPTVRTANESGVAQLPSLNFPDPSSSTIRQTAAYEYFQYLCLNRTRVYANTPFGVFNNLAIMAVIPIQDEDTRYMSSFQLHLKQLRFASTQLYNIGSGRNSQQATPPVPNGSTQGTVVQPGTPSLPPLPNVSAISPTNNASGPSSAQVQSLNNQYFSGASQASQSLKNGTPPVPGGN